MARLQDFQTVTPTDSDKMLVIQSQGQGLAPWNTKLNSANPTGTGTFSLNRKDNTTTGSASVAVGYQCTASANQAFAEGQSTIASGGQSHAEGLTTTASGSRSHAEGQSTTASGSASHSEGRSTTASGDYSHAEGQSNTASGNQSHVEGYSCEANGTLSHVEGRSTIASRWAHHVFGAYNVADTTGADANAKGTYIEIVGKGTADNARSNARTLDWNGNEVLAGNLFVNTNQPVATMIPIDESSLSTSINDKASWDSAFGHLPSTYNGMVIITFKSGYKAVGFAIKTASNWGSIMGMTNDNLNPYFYTMANGTSVLHRLAYAT